ncbi:MAG: S8 family serine peptidase, partial [Dehalococcoidia bacterium]
MRLARLVPLLVLLLLLSWFSAHADELVPYCPGDACSSPSTDLDLDIGVLPPKGPPKLESSLWQLVEAQRRGGLRGLSVEAKRSGITLHDAAARVVVEARPGRASAVADAAAFQGGVVETSYGDLVQVLAPVGSLEALSNSEGVRFVRQPTRYSPEVTGEGVGLVNANVWQAAGITGGHVKVAVLDEGFSGYSSLLGSELPSSVITRSFRADPDITGGGKAHGTAVAEIVHEVAPGAQMYLVNFETDPELGNAVAWIVSQGVNVINFSMGCAVCGPGNGTGFANDLVSWAVSNGVVWANGAGNEAGLHWAGDWYNPDGNAWHNFTFGGETNSVYLLAGESIWVGLKWDDSWDSSCNDYDLCLFDSALNRIGCTANVQNCGNAHPVEQLLVTAPSSGSYGIAIYRYSATGISHFNMYIDASHPMQYIVAAGSLLIPADNPDAITVGAVPWSSPNTIESFSSQGPTEDGRTKPDLVGPDRVSGATYGPSGFAGTSAASPHVAGAAALVKQAFPAYTPAQIKSFLEGRAVPLGAPGKDNVYGSGRLNLGSMPGRCLGICCRWRSGTLC